MDQKLDHLNFDQQHRTFRNVRAAFIVIIIIITRLIPRRD